LGEKSAKKMGTGGISKEEEACFKRKGAVPRV